MLEVRKLKKKFGNNLVLKGIDLQIKKGERIAIIGPSGCGKSTLLRCLNMIEVPSSGKVIFDNKEVVQIEDELTLFRRKVGMVFQQFNLFPHLTVLDNIILAPVKLGVLTEKEATKRALELLDSIGLRKKFNNYPDELSGGQKQRVAIVRTLIMEPEIILFDEPTSALDPEMVGEVLDLIKKVAERNITTVIVSHEMNFVKNFATRILFVDAGKIIFDGGIEDFYNISSDDRIRNFCQSLLNK